MGRGVIFLKQSEYATVPQWSAENQMEAISYPIPCTFYYVGDPWVSDFPAPSTDLSQPSSLRVSSRLPRRSRGHRSQELGRPGGWHG